MQMIKFAMRWNYMLSDRYNQAIIYKWTYLFSKFYHVTLRLRVFLIFIAPSLGTGQSPESPSLPPFCLQTPVQPHLDIPYRNPLLLPHCSLCSMPFPSVPDLLPPFSLSLLLPCIQARIQKFHNPILWFTKQFLRPLLDTEDEQRKS